ncbi:hypothetical protein PC116_g31195 [Phytophthora cactorum]|nr:hypothetical protein PC116_g31195 [Phytophthora cactorum]
MAHSCQGLAPIFLVLLRVSLGTSADLRCANVAICTPADEKATLRRGGCDTPSPMVGHVEIRTLSLVEATYVAQVLALLAL